MYGTQWSKLSPRKRNAKRQNDCLRKPYKQLRKEKTQKAQEKRRDIGVEGRVPTNSKKR